MARGIPKSGGINSGWFKPGHAGPKTKAHRKAISEGQRIAWQTKRKRLPIGSKNHDTNGYIRIKVFAGAGPWKQEHIYVMENKIGRHLKPGESVHHIDGVRTNNDISNLYLCKSNSHHIKLENQIKKVLRELLKRGVVSFSHKHGRYEI